MYHVIVDGPVYWNSGNASIVNKRCADVEAIGRGDVRSPAENEAAVEEGVCSQLSDVDRPVVSACKYCRPNWRTRRHKGKRRGWAWDGW